MNIYKGIAGKPMIYSIESARAFLEQTKDPLLIYVAELRAFFEIHLFKVSYFTRDHIGNMSLDIEKEFHRDESAIKFVYEHRKYINRYYK